MRTARNLVAVAASLFAVVAASGSAHGQSAEQVIDKMIRADNEALEGIDNYVMQVEVMGVETLSYFEKEAQVRLSNGQTAYVMRSVPVSGSSTTGATAGDLDRAAAAMPGAGAQMEQGMHQEMQSAGLPPGVGDMLIASNEDEPWLSANPSDMTGMYATMLGGAAEGERQRSADAKADSKQLSKDLQRMKARSKVVGRETVDGKKTIVVESKGEGTKQRVDEGEFEVDRVRMWVDAKRYVPVRMRIEGTMRQGTETRPIVLERNDRDYREVPGCGGMYEPFVSVMKMSGMLNAEDKAQLEEARAKLADFDKQMASMPPEQREMVMNQMGPQRKMLESLAAGGGMEIESRIISIRCNGGPPAAKVPAAVSDSQRSATPAGAAPSAGASSSMTPAQEACLKERMAAAEAAKKRKRGLGRLLSVASKSAGRAGVAEVGEAVNEAQSADATAQELKAAAADLGSHSGRHRGLRGKVDALFRRGWPVAFVL